MPKRECFFRFERNVFDSVERKGVEEVESTETPTQMGWRRKVGQLPKRGRYRIRDLWLSRFGGMLIKIMMIIRVFLERLKVINGSL